MLQKIWKDLNQISKTVLGNTTERVYFSRGLHNSNLIALIRVNFNTFFFVFETLTKIR